MRCTVFTDPPSAGQDESILERFRADLRTGTSRSKLIVPTATMAEHRRNQLAREGFVFSPGRVATLAKYIERWSPVRRVPPAALGLLLDRALEHAGAAVFSQVMAFPGFRSSVAGLIREAAMAGCTPSDLERAAAGDSCQTALAAVWAEVERRLERCGMALRSGVLKAAAARIAPVETKLFFDGFHTLGASELAVIESLASKTSVEIALPRWPGSVHAIERLLGNGFEEHRTGSAGTGVLPILVTPPTLDQEAEEIARRVLGQASEGRRFGEMSVIVRGDCPQVGALRTAFERFGIPARFYFAAPLAASPIVEFLSDLIGSMLGHGGGGGCATWDWAGLAQALRRNASGLRDDRLDFELRERLPGSGLEGLCLPTRIMDVLGRMSCWTSERRTASEWANCLADLASSFSQQTPRPGTLRDADIWRARAAAIEQFRTTAEELASVFDPEDSLEFAAFWERLREALRDTELRVSDSRRNVVHVMDAYEARQWRLPVVFLAGMLERQFPRYQGETQLISEETRHRLRAASIRLRTAADKQEEERFLFDTAVTRATEMLVVSYPRFNDQGDENLPSFYLRDLACRVEPARPARPRPGRPARRSRAEPLQAPELLSRIADRHARIGPTAVETYLQCPFQFFASRTLELRRLPLDPDDRFDFLLQGTMIHRVLEESAGGRNALGAVFARVFDEQAAKARLRRGFLTESIRLELLRDLERFQSEESHRQGACIQSEQKFEMPLGDGISIRGRIDRLDQDSQGRLLVIDYKYSATVSDKVQAAESGERVQAGLYLLAVRHVFDREPAGMLYCSLKKGVEWDGWHVSDCSFGGARCLPEYLGNLMEAARSRTLAVMAEIRAGRVEVHPADLSRCGLCDYADICRYGEAAAEPERGPGVEAAR